MVKQLRDSTGKVMKGPNYKAIDLKKVILGDNYGK